MTTSGSELIKVVETGRYILKYKEKFFIFDLIFNLHADLGTTLYTEGTGNLTNVKAATNPVKAVFRKNTSSEMFTTTDNSVEKQGENILFSRYNTDEYKIFLEDEDGSYLIQDADLPEYETISMEHSIYEWIDALNSGTEIDRDNFFVYGEIAAEYKTNSISSKKNYLISLFELKGAILVDAVIRRNVYKEGGRSFSELTFVVDSLTGTLTRKKLSSLVG